MKFVLNMQQNIPLDTVDCRSSQFCCGNSGINHSSVAFYIHCAIKSRFFKTVLCGL